MVKPATKVRLFEVIGGVSFFLVLDVWSKISTLLENAMKLPSLDVERSDPAR
jgi:hypothetical protein